MTDPKTAFACPPIGMLPRVPGAVEDVCDRCGQEVLVGPRVQTLKLIHPGAPILCTPCGLAGLKEDGTAVMLGTPEADALAERLAGGS